MNRTDDRQHTKKYGYGSENPFFNRHFRLFCTVIQCRFLVLNRIGASCRGILLTGDTYRGLVWTSPPSGSPHRPTLRTGLALHPVRTLRTVRTLHPPVRTLRTVRASSNPLRSFSLSGFRRIGRPNQVPFCKQAYNGTCFGRPARTHCSSMFSIKIP